MKTTEDQLVREIKLALFGLTTVYGSVPLQGRQLTYAKGERPYRLAEADGKPIAAFASPEDVAQFLTKQ
jgi:hypothetical protein